MNSKEFLKALNEITKEELKIKLNKKVKLFI